MKLMKRIHAAATDMYIDAFYLQEIFVVLAFLTIVIVAVMVAIL